MWLIQDKLSRIRFFAYMIQNPRYFVVLMLTTLVLGGAVGLGVFLESWWWALAIVAGGLLLIAVVFLAYVLLRQKEKEALAKADEVEDEALSERQRAANEREQLYDLRRRMQRATEEIRRARLDRDIDFPWLAVIGARGAGKTSAIREAGLDLPAEYRALLSEGPTQGADVWITNEAVVVDIAGSLVEADDGPLRAAWRTVIRSLRKARKRLPLNGLVLALSVSQLLGRSERQLEEDARRVRRRINELREGLKVDFPIYVVVTHSDLLQGFVELSGHVAPAQLGEALGWTNPERVVPDAGEEALDGLLEVRERIDGFLPQILQREADPGRRRRLFLFPQELEGLGQALAAYCRQAFKPSIREGAPFLRGVYLTSASRGGSIISPVLQAMGHDWAQASVPPSSEPGGQFISDIFREIAIGDATLALPTRGLGTIGRRFVIGLGAVAMLTMVALWGLAFRADYDGLQVLRADTRTVVSTDAGLPALDRLRSTVVSQSEAIEHWRRRLGFGGIVRRGIANARRSYVWGFQRRFEEPTKARLTGALRAYSDRSFEALAALALDITWLVSGAEAEENARPPLCGWASIPRTQVDCDSFTQGYDAWVRWATPPDLDARIERERELVSGTAATLLTLERLEQWSEQHPDQHPHYRYADAGLPTGRDPLTETSVAGAYTRRTWEFLVERLLEAVDRSGSATDGQVEQFRQRYNRRFDLQWRDFLMSTPELSVPASRPQASPYIRLVEGIGYNVRAEIGRDGPTPRWVDALDALLPPEIAPGKEASDLVPTGGEAGAEDEAAPDSPAWQAYMDLLDQAALDLHELGSSDREALRAVEGVSTGKENIFSDAMKQIREIVPGRGLTAEEEKVHQLLAMPFQQGFSDVIDDALDSLDNRWRQRISTPFSGTLNEEELQSLYAPRSGELDSFLVEDLAEFYDPSTGRPRELLEGKQVPLGPRFLNWMSGAREFQDALFGGLGGGQRELSVRLTGIPSQIGGGLFLARRELTIVCDGEPERFVYREGSGDHRFRWSPGCREVQLRVWVRAAGEPERELRPRKEWQGPLAFSDFLQQAKPIGNQQYTWRFDYEGVPPVELSYGVRGGKELRGMQHRQPPVSLRD